MPDRLTRQQVDDFLERHKDPADARRFLQEAGLIDENGELAAPYRVELPADDFDALQRRLAEPGQYDPRVARVLSTSAPWDG
jgi:hypothetical protein